MTEETGSPWTQREAIELCQQIEQICPDYGCHVALTGGLLYKDGKRKDADILFYRIRQVEKIDIEGLMNAIGKIGIVPIADHGWCYKAVWIDYADFEHDIDFFFPDREGEYPIMEQADEIPFDLHIPEYRA